jgi:hypothetical protein
MNMPALKSCLTTQNICFFDCAQDHGHHAHVTSRPSPILSKLLEPTAKTNPSHTGVWTYYLILSWLPR